MKQDHWEEEILRSLEGIERAKPRPELYNQLRNKIFGHSPQVLPRSYALMTAAGLALLVIINIQVLQQPPTPVPQVSTYAIDHTNFSIYP